MEAKDIMHPEDAKAIQMLKKLKGFDDLIRWMMENGYEKTFRGENLGFMLKVSERNFPEINLLFKSVVKQVGINMPELYIPRWEQNIPTLGMKCSHVGNQKKNKLSLCISLTYLYLCPQILKHK